LSQRKLSDVFVFFSVRRFNKDTVLSYLMICDLFQNCKRGTRFQSNVAED
jgi:hypothetical protein